MNISEMFPQRISLTKKLKELYKKSFNKFLSKFEKFKLSNHKNNSLSSESEDFSDYEKLNDRLRTNSKKRFFNQTNEIEDNIVSNLSIQEKWIFLKSKFFKTRKIPNNKLNKIKKNFFVENNKELKLEVENIKNTEIQETNNENKLDLNCEIMKLYELMEKDEEFNKIEERKKVNQDYLKNLEKSKRNEITLLRRENANLMFTNTLKVPEKNELNKKFESIIRKPQNANKKKKNVGIYEYSDDSIDYSQFNLVNFI